MDFKHDTVIIIDTSYLIFKSFFSYPHLNTKENPTGAFYGFIKAVIKMMKDHKTEFFVFARDLPTPTWRHKELSTYKAGRPEPAPELRFQFPIISDWAKTVSPTNTIAVEGFEADDLVLSAVNYINNNKLAKNILIFSSDRDLYQIFSGNDNVRFIHGLELFTKDNFIQKYNVRPQQWIDWKALVGDSGDNLKGVDSIGPKTASLILNQIDSLDPIKTFVETGEMPEILKSFCNGSAKNQQLLDKIVKSWDTACQTRRLATLTNVGEIKLDPNELIDLNLGIGELEKYNFASIIKDLEYLNKKKNREKNLDNNPEKKLKTPKIKENASQELF